MIGRQMKLRFFLSAFFFVIAMTGLGVRLAFLQLSPRDEFRRNIENHRHFTERIGVRRGDIYDCNGAQNILALDLAVQDVCADPSLVVKSNAVLEVAMALADQLDLEVDEVAVKLKSPGRKYVRIKRFVPADLADKIRAQKLTGVFFRDANVRYYPQDSFMCHVLGFVNYEGVGSAGIEQRKNSVLKGVPGVIEGVMDAKRHELYLQRMRENPGREGSDVQLTLDQNVQHIVEKELDRVMRDFSPKGAWCIVQRITTGEIIAMASRPAYNLNEFRTALDDSKLNRAISYVYEPGSTMKAACFAAALDEGLVSPNTMFSCEGGAWLYHGRVLHDCHDYGRITVADGLKKSSNILTAKIALILGNKRLYKYMSDFGIGRSMGVDLPGEEAGIFHPVSKWSAISTTRVPIGQGVAVTALQMLGVYCTIANHGYMMKPYVIKRIVDCDGKSVYEAKPQVVRRVIKPDTAETMCRLLARVTEDHGTGTRARIDGFTVAGKTGTAQKPVRGGYSSTDYMSSFVGFFPAEQPQIGIIVVVDTPRGSHYGGTVAAPAFSTIGEGTARCLELRAPVHATRSGRSSRRAGAEG